MEPVDQNQTRRMKTELQSLSRHLLEKLDESRSMGRFGQAEIELLRKKLSVVVNAFSAERQKIEGEFNTVRGGEGFA
jgi:predicted  nucleic acid-binding Zn-ribbon protein